MTRSTYTEHAETAGQSAVDVAALRESRRTVVEGCNLKPIRAFEHSGDFWQYTVVVMLIYVHYSTIGLIENSVKDCTVKPIATFQHLGPVIQFLKHGSCCFDMSSSP